MRERARLPRLAELFQPARSLILNGGAPPDWDSLSPAFASLMSAFNLHPQPVLQGKNRITSFTRLLPDFVSSLSFCVDDQAAASTKAKVTKASSYREASFTGKPVLTALIR
jgi:hypothetical protein